MNRHFFIIPVFMAVVFFQGHAKIPVQDIPVRSATAEYVYAQRGQMITEQDVNANEYQHFLWLRFSPAPYVIAGVGAGVDKLKVDIYQRKYFEGGYGFSPAASLWLFTPGLGTDLLRLIGGIDFVYLNSQDRLGYVYEGSVLDPFLGAHLTLGKYAAVELGGKGHFMDGNMRNAKTKAEFGKFSNRNIFRTYASVIMKSPGDNVFLSLDLEASSKFSKNWGSNGPIESTYGISVGFIIKEDEKFRELEKKSNTFFPGFDSLKTTVDKTGKELE